MIKEIDYIENRLFIRIAIFGFNLLGWNCWTMGMCMEKKMVVSSVWIGNAKARSTPTIGYPADHPSECKGVNCLPPAKPYDRGCEKSNGCRSTPSLNSTTATLMST